MHQPVSVSVVIPCYDAAADVRTAVASVLAQTHPPLEIICVDDGSTDETLAVLRELEAAHPELVLVIAQENRGACAARNRGLAEARGTYVQFLDADDELAPEKLRHQLHLASTHDLPDLIAGSHTHETSEGTRRVQEVTAGNPWVRLVESGMGITSANLWKREAVLAAGGWNEQQRSSQEYELMFRMLASGSRTAFDNVSHATIRKREASISRQSDADIVALGLRERIVIYLRKNKVLDGEVMDDVMNASFRVVRRIYPLHPEEAVAVHNRMFPSSFSPRVDGYTTLPYALVYRLVGLKGAERMKKMIRRG